MDPAFFIPCEGEEGSGRVTSVCGCIGFTVLLSTYNFLPLRDGVCDCIALYSMFLSHQISLCKISPAFHVESMLPQYNANFFLFFSVCIYIFVPHQSGVYY
eukprot:TRINITY_DN113873_c0_g1_i4.p1 TRINITY_DN113873_c0_g1~~TRINITY_DN113873_c0_g1_i4.p1  ORF type:complete len:101 (-),score=8.05 TRINITY_DN113873_c0_g1_i4:191-493(-)